MSLEKAIELLYKRNPIFKDALQETVNNMLNKCRYMNEESLERHNWGTAPKKLKYIPEDLDKKNEYYLLKALEHNENDNIDNSIIELLWGDVQLGKRIQACIIMWFSVHILKRPVLYIFRNLTIDQKQLQEDIIGTNEFSFNTVFIKNIFKKYNDEINDVMGENRNDYYKDFILPELKEINTVEALNKLNDKEAINSRDIFCCLMNCTQLDKINTKFSEYIFNNNELVNMTVLIDESDLMSPTAHNDRTDKDYILSANCEKLLAKIYKKSKYVLHITGTAHSLLYNVTTKLIFNEDYEEVKNYNDDDDDDEDDDNDDTSIDSDLVPVNFKDYYVNLKISKVHKMKRSQDYYGLFNNKIVFNTDKINEWWLDKKGRKYKSFSIIEDYSQNIQNIIKSIIDRDNYKYNSLLISEEKIRSEQIELAKLILKDFEDLFLIIFHGNCLRLYLNKKYNTEIKKYVKQDSELLKKARLNVIGGIYGEPIIYSNIKKKILFENNYCYYDIDLKICNIKMIYKVLRMLFDDSTQVTTKTVITITGKYGERGYSFTSDDFGKYTFHLTDQYFLSQSKFNCTDISQRLRIQGKYSDEELKNGNMKLTIWTTTKFKDVIQNFYVYFINQIEKVIMTPDSWEKIKESIEDIIDDGYLKLGVYLKYLDTSKKTKNISLIKKNFDDKIMGYKLINVDSWSDEEISTWCKSHNLPNYICINKIINSDEVVKKLKSNIFTITKPIYKTFDTLQDMLIYCDNNGLNKPTNKWFTQENGTRNSEKPKCYIGKDFEYLKFSDIIPGLLTWGLGGKINCRFNIYYENDDVNYDRPKYMIRYIAEIEVNGLKKIKHDQKDVDLHINPAYHNIIINKTNNKYLLSKIKDEYKDKRPDNYYWKTTDNWLCLYKKDKKDLLSIKIKKIPQINKDILVLIDDTKYIRNGNQIFTIMNGKKHNFFCDTYQDENGKWVIYE